MSLFFDSVLQDPIKTVPIRTKKKDSDQRLREGGRERERKQITGESPLDLSP